MRGEGLHDAAGLVGRAFGEFVIREPLSSGGFGMVFRAEQPTLEREAVIKVLHVHHLNSETVVRRFLREARLASRLDHPTPPTRTHSAPSLTASCGSRWSLCAAPRSIDCSRPRAPSRSTASSR